MGLYNNFTAKQLHKSVTSLLAFYPWRHDQLQGFLTLQSTFSFTTSNYTTFVEVFLLMEHALSLHCYTASTHFCIMIGQCKQP